VKKMLNLEPVQIPSLVLNMDGDLFEIPTDDVSQTIYLDEDGKPASSENAFWKATWPKSKDPNRHVSKEHDVKHTIKGISLSYLNMKVFQTLGRFGLVSTSISQIDGNEKHTKTVAYLSHKRSIKRHLDWYNGLIESGYCDDSIGKMHGAWYLPPEKEDIDIS
jgi:hypothetical protein